MREANRIAIDAFEGRWENVPDHLTELIRKILPEDIVKCMQYDLKRDPARYELHEEDS